ncbi:MAG TPA: hypothetical protein VG167_12670 [Verrucomicrobiae bacterium]|nr:hypothetical protein [Verrucomicrobiae bacterium]
MTHPDANDPGMNLDELQRKKVAAWVAEGLKLSEIQNRLQAEFGAQMTYMEVRLLVDDLKLTPKDIEPPKPSASALAAGAAAPAKPPAPESALAGKPGAKPAGGVAVSVDQLTRAGAVVSGKVTFSDGNRAEWYLDQTGRLGLVTQQPGYRPPAADVQQFQTALDAELSKLGF